MSDGGKSIARSVLRANSRRRKIVTLDGSGASRAAGEGLHNEDAFVVNSGMGLYLVCDGMSEAPAGELAARVGARALEEFVARVGTKASGGDGWVDQAVVERAMDHAISAVALAEREDPELSGLTTTMTMLLAHRNVGVIGHRGDSRAYLVRRDRAHQLTVDHEWTERGESLGASANAFDVFTVLLLPGDTVVLCTDGAEAIMENPDFVDTIGDHSPRVVASRLVSAAHDRSPDVDATAVVVRVRGERERGWIELSSPPFQTAFGHTLQTA
jgi:serine/threonine protein phosphatase PrpC